MKNRVSYLLLLAVVMAFLLCALYCRFAAERLVIIEY